MRQQVFVTIRDRATERLGELTLTIDADGVADALREPLAAGFRRALERDLRGRGRGRGRGSRIELLHVRTGTAKATLHEEEQPR